MSDYKVEEPWSMNPLAKPEVFMLHYHYFNTYKLRYFPSKLRVQKYIDYHKRPQNHPHMFEVINVWKFNGEDVKEEFKL